MELLNEQELLKIKRPAEEVLKSREIGYIYFLFYNDTIVYVGQSVSYYARIPQHKDKTFNGFSVVEVPVTEMDKWEREYISALSPFYNHTANKTPCVPKNTYRKIGDMMFINTGYKLIFKVTPTNHIVDIKDNAVMGKVIDGYGYFIYGIFTYTLTAFACKGGVVESKVSVQLPFSINQYSNELQIKPKDFYRLDTSISYYFFQKHFGYKSGWAEINMNKAGKKFETDNHVKNVIDVAFECLIKPLPPLELRKQWGDNLIVVK